MKATMKETFLKIALVFLLSISIRAAAQDASAAEAPAAAAPAAAEQAPALNIPAVIPPFDFKDIYGRVVKADDLKGWIVVYVFGNDKNADTGVDWIKKITYGHPNVKGVLYVIVADASKFDKIMYPLVKRVVKEEYHKKIIEIKKEFAEKNIPIDYAVEDRYMMTLDIKGDVFKLFGVWDDRKNNQIVIVDGDRNVVAHFSAFSDEVNTAFGKTIDEREAKSSYKMVTHKRKKNMAKRALYTGAAAGLLYLIF